MKAADCCPQFILSVGFQWPISSSTADTFKTSLKPLLFLTCIRLMHDTPPCSVPLWLSLDTQIHPVHVSQICHSLSACVVSDILSSNLQNKSQLMLSSFFILIAVAAVLNACVIA